MSRKVYVNVTLHVILQVDDGVELSDVMDEADFNFLPDERATVEDVSMRHYEVADSK